MGKIKPTWFGIPGHDKCSDLIWTSVAWIRRARACGVLQESISFTDREDHLPVWAQMCYEVPVPDASAGRRRLDPAKLQDPPACASFRAGLAALAPHIPKWQAEGQDVYHQELTSEVRRLQEEHFFSPHAQVQKKPWITSDTWEVVRRTPALRRASVAAKHRLAQDTLRWAWRAWTGLRAACRHRWQHAQDDWAQVVRSRQLAAVAGSELAAHRNLTRALTRADRMAWGEELSARAGPGGRSW